MKQQFSLFLIFLSYLSFSQTVDVKWGPPKKYKKSSVEYGFVGQDQSGIYTLSYDDKLLFLTKTSKDNLGKIFEKQLLWENLRSQIKSRDITFRGFKKFKTHFVLFQNDIDNKANKRVLYGQKVNFNGDAEGALTKLDDNELARQSKEGSMSLIYSKDSLKFAILKNPTFDKYADEKFNFKIYDSDLKLLHRLELELPFRDKFFTLVETKLGSDNTIYLLAKVEIPRDKKQKEEAQFYYTVVTVNPKEGGEVKIFDIKLDGKYVDEVSMEIDKDDNLRCLGLYSNLNERGKPEKGLHGLVYLTVDKQSKQIGNKSIKEFSKALVEELSGKKRAEKDKGIETSFKLKYFLEKEDESFVALMEEEYMTVTTSTYMTGNGGMRTTTTYHYDSNSILAINIDSEGKITSFVTIPKSQSSANDGGMYNSFYATYFNGKTYMIYNDHKENAINKNFDRTSSPYRSVPVIVTLDNSGKFQKAPIGDPNEKHEFMMKPKEINKITDNSALFYGVHSPKGCSCTCLGFLKPTVMKLGLIEIH